METNSLPQEPGGSGCAVCNHPVIEPGHPTDLCKECRDKFVKFPIPVGIKIFGLAILVLMAFSMYKLPKNLTAAAHFKRGVDAIGEKRYFTAERELSTVIRQQPNYMEAKEYLAIAAFNNGNFGLFGQMIEKLEGKEIEDEDILSQLNSLMAKAANYYPADSFYQLIDQYGKLDSIPLVEIQHYAALHNGEMYSVSRLAGMLFEKDRYMETDSLINGLLAADPSYMNALYLKTSVKRQLGQFDSSHYYCDQILMQNAESSYAVASNARTYLMEKKDDEGLKWAQKANAIEPGDGYVMATLSLAYYFNKNAGESDRLVDVLRKDSANATYAQYVLDVKSGKEKFRN